MPVNVEKAFDFAQDTTRQILSLSTAVLTLTIAFQKDIIGGTSDDGARMLKYAWVAYLVSIVFGLFTLMNLSGNLERPGDGGEPSIYRRSILVCSSLQVLTFGLGAGFTVWFGLATF